MSSPLNLLVSIPYLHRWAIEQIQREPNIRLLLDSGAFTNFKAGKPYPLDDYCRFLDQLTIKPYRYFTLDVIGDHAASMRNYELLLKRGYKPIPIFTRGAPLEHLEHYYQTCDIVGLGALVGTRGNRGFVNGMMRLIGKRPVHWLGFTQLQFLRRYQPAMCDASSFEAGARYGQLRLYMGHGHFKSYSRQALADAPPAVDFLQRIAHYGYDPYALRHERSWRGGESMVRLLCAASTVDFSTDIERVLGVKLFVAWAANGFGKQLIDAYQRRPQ